MRLRCFLPTPGNFNGRARGMEDFVAVKVLNSNPVLAVHDLERSAAWYRDVRRLRGP